jgi:Na+-transporting NADH:ubiquinone oxidoreductase subunit B
MKWLKNILDKIKPHFDKGGYLEKYYPVFEATDTILFSTDKRTHSGPHIRDSLDVKRVMILVVIALLPAYIFGAMNIGYQMALSLGQTNTWSENLIQGALKILPIIAVTFGAGALWEIIFSVVRKHPISEGFLVTCALIPLIMPPTIPLWQVAVATSFGIVIGKEIFGGVGMNIFNPALVARAFLFFTYPVRISGDKVWISGPDGYSGATALAIPAAEKSQDAVTLLDSVSQFDYSWLNMFMGWVPGSIGETSTLWIMVGAIFLLVTGMASWRVMVGAIIGLTGMATLTNFMAELTGSSNTMLTLPAHYHLVMGGFAFGVVFMATLQVCSISCSRSIYHSSWCNVTSIRTKR